MYVSYCQHQHHQPNQQADALVFENVWAGYSSSQTPAIRNISLTIPHGACVALVGPNGAGKSTLFKVAANLLPVTQGRVSIFGHNLGACHHRVVYLPQRADIDWQFPISVKELVLSGRYVYLGWFKRPGKNEEHMVNEALDELGVLDLSHRQISQLSGGQQQRVLIARALVQQADLLMLDEPLNAVDVTTRAVVSKVLHQLKHQGKTVLVATHFFDNEQSRYDGAIYLKDGEQIKQAHQGHVHGPECDH